MASLADEAVWAPLGSLFGCAIRFEDIVVNMLPSIVALFLSPLVISDYFRQPIYVRNSPLLWLKLVRLDTSLSCADQPQLTQLAGGRCLPHCS